MTKAKEEMKPVDLSPEAVPDAAESQALAKADNGSLVPGEVTGEIGAGDIKIPTLRIMQRMSDNPQKLDLGLITVNGETVIEADGEARITIISIQKKYEEIMAFGAGIPQRFDRLEDAILGGFRLCRSKQDRDSGVPLVEETAIVTLVAHQPEGALDRSFPFALGDTRGVPALWYLRSFAYGNIAKSVFSKLAFDLRGTELLEAQWKITTEKRSNSYGEFFVPHIQLATEVNDEAFIADVRKDLNFT